MDSDVKPADGDLVQRTTGEFSPDAASSKRTSLLQHSRARNRFLINFIVLIFSYQEMMLSETIAKLRLAQLACPLRAAPADGNDGC
jgi:hypothetical protein